MKTGDNTGYIHRMYIYVYTHVHIYVCVHVCVCVCYTYMHICSYFIMHVYANMHVLYVNMRVYVC